MTSELICKHLKENVEELGKVVDLKMGVKDKIISKSNSLIEYYSLTYDTMVEQLKEDYDNLIYDYFTLRGMEYIMPYIRGHFKLGFERNANKFIPDYYFYIDYAMPISEVISLINEDLDSLYNIIFNRLFNATNRVIVKLEEKKVKTIEGLKRDGATKEEIEKETKDYDYVLKELKDGTSSKAKQLRYEITYDDGFYEFDLETCLEILDDKED